MPGQKRLLELALKGLEAERQRIDEENRRYSEADSRWRPEKPHPSQTTTSGQSSAAIGCTFSAAQEQTDTCRTEEIVGPNEASVGGEEESRQISGG